jgi:hypothetical protein
VKGDSCFILICGKDNIILILSRDMNVSHLS